jgi:hypothetical protein
VARLVLTAIGTYIGYQVGYPQLGAFLGSLAGGAVERGMAPDQRYESPKIDDLRVIGLEFGDAIAYIKGAPVLAGQLWWASDRRAIPNTVSQSGGKGGGPTVSQTSYTYEVDCRVGFTCNQVVGLSRLWINEKLVFNVRSDATVGAVGNSLQNIMWRRMTVYTGATSQLPDPTEEAAVGAGNSPAYVGGASIVFEGLQLGPSGNMPNVRAEWFTKGTAGGTGYHDRLNDALAVHYSAITGSVDAFSRGSTSDYGETVVCPERTNTTSDDIRRTVPLSTAIGIRFKFKLGVNLTGEDSGEIYFNNASGSTNRFFFTPRREAAIDPASRPRLLVSGSSFFLGSVALDPGWYQFDLTIAPGVSGGSVVTISRLPDEAVVISQTLAGTFNALDIGTQGFYMDATLAIPTTEAEFSDIYVLPTRATIQNETLRDVVDALLLRSGLQASEFDTSALASITNPVRALAISQVTSARHVIDLLRANYFFDCVLSDKLYFRPRGGAAVATIPFAELGASESLEGDPEPLSITPGSELELPGTWAMSYMNIDADCTKDTQQSDRLGSAARTSQGQEVPLGFTAAEAKAIVDTWRDDALVAAMGTTSIKLLLHHAAKEPGDVLSVVARDGSTYRLRMVNLVESGLVRTFDAVFDDANVLTQAGITSTDYIPSSEVSVPGITVLRILDIALLRDADNGVGLYGATRGDGTSHPGSVVFKSADDSDWSQQVSITESAVLGSTSTALGNWTGGNLADEASVVTVNVGPGALSSVTHAAMVDAEANLCLIGNEVLQFRTASLVSPGVYILSGFLRGRKGTDWAMTGHAAGDRFVLLQTTGMRRIPLETSEIGNTRYWRGVTIGRDINSAGSQSATFAATSQKPHAPVSPRAARDGSGNLTFTWDRRSRLSMNSDNASLPLGEAVEAYRVRVYVDGTFATVKREFAIVTTASQAYSAAEQTTDFGSAQATVHWKVHQISEQVGEGYTAQASN